jgi:hypothetical protein
VSGGRDRRALPPAQSPVATAPTALSMPIAATSTSLPLAAVAAAPVASGGRSRFRTAFLLFAGVALVYLASPVVQLSDSWYSLLTAQRLATHASLDLATVTSLAPDQLPLPVVDGLPYPLRRHGTRVLYDFPLGASLLAAPWMGFARVIGLGVEDATGTYLPGRERAHQRLLAALASAAFVTASFVAARSRLPAPTACWFAAAVALATPVWSTTSRGLWSSTAALALLGATLPLLVPHLDGRRQAGGSERDVAPGPPAWRLGLLAGGAYVCRPTAGLAVLVLGAWLLLRHRRIALRFALGAAAPLALLVGISRGHWGTWLPPYYLASRLGPAEREALLGVLFSPSRGLLVFTPVLALALVYGLLRLRRLVLREAFVLGIVGLALHTAMLACFPHWWGGHGYGPRLYAEALPFQVLLLLAVVTDLFVPARCGQPAGSRAATALDAAAPPAAGRERRHRCSRRLLLGLAGLGFLLHAAGALSHQSNLWNSRPAEIDRQPERLWDWQDPQWLAWANRRPRQPSTSSEPR